MTLKDLAKELKLKGYEVAYLADSNDDFITIYFAEPGSPVIASVYFDRFEGYRTSIVHKPGKGTGTAYATFEGVDLQDVLDNAEKYLVFEKPNWYRRVDFNKIILWRNMDEMVNQKLNQMINMRKL